MPEDFLTVSELNHFIKDVINSGFPRALWVCGEIQGYDRNRAKTHVFFELIEKDKNSKDITARIGLVIFSGRKQFISDILKKTENAFELKDDIEVKFACRVDFYAPHGAVRLIVEDIDPTYTLGKLAQEKQKLIALLKEKGVLDKNKTTQLPLVPLSIGLITADDSAAYNDFISELNKSGYRFNVYLRDTLMQGKKAEADICRAIDALQKLESIDVIVITRGGGSIADLSCFDSRIIAEKIAESRLPVLSGIGHEINLTITDLAAHTFAKTPTAVAQFIVERIGQFLQNLKDKGRRVLDTAQEKLYKERQNIKGLAFDLHHLSVEYFQSHREKMAGFIRSLEREPLLKIRAQRSSISERQKTLSKILSAYFSNNRQKINNYKKMVDMVAPANTMKRGFSITRTEDGRLIKNTKDAASAEFLVTEVSDGIFKSSIMDVKREGKRGGN